MIFSLLFVSMLSPQSPGSWELERIVDGSHAYGRLGDQAIFLEDLNGDSIPDFAMSEPKNGKGVVRVYSGATSVQLFEISPSAGSSISDFGEAMERYGDWDGDGRQDFLVAGYSDPGTSSIYILSGLDGSTFLQFGRPQASSSGLKTIRDTNGDGYPEVLFASAAWQLGKGYLAVHNGADGAELFSFTGTSANQSLGWGVCAPGDLNSDGVPDFIHKEDYFTGLVSARSGVDGALLYSVDGGAYSSTFGYIMDTVGDLNDDGCLDWIASGKSDDWRIEGSVFVMSGKDGSLLFEVNQLETTFATNVAGVGDVDGDGVPDFAANDARRASGQWDVMHGVRIFSGVDGRVIGLVGGVQEFDGAGFFSIDGFFDVNGDGRSDVLVGAPQYHHLPNLTYAGGGYVFSFDPHISVSPSTISAATGGVISFDLDFPDTEADMGYFLGFSNMRAGIHRKNGVVLPLGRSTLSAKKSYLRNPVWDSPIGTLDSFGDATTTLTFLPGRASGIIGRSFAFAALSFNRQTGRARTSSARMVVTVEP